MNKTYLFVYGTLRKEYGLELIQDMADKLRFLGHGKVKAALYDLGAYPAAVEVSGKAELRGDVYEVADAEAVLLFLDEYEGEEYRRELTTVMMEAGEMIKAFIYWYKGETEATLRIEESDYLSYLKTKKTVSYKWNTIQ